MRVAFIVNNYPPRTGGVELHVRALALELIRLGHEPLVITLGPDPGEELRDGVPVITLPEHMRVANILGFPGLGTRSKLTLLLRKRRVDAVSVHTRFFPMSYVGYRAARAANLPVIHTEHGSGHVESNSAVITWASRLVDWTAGRAVLRGADTVLGVSEEVCDFVRRLSAVNAKLFYNAISLVEGDGEPVPQLPNRLVFVGRLVPGKGWDDFLELVHSERQVGHPVEGHIVGDGPDMAELRRRVEALDLTRDVVVHGRVPQSEVRPLLRGATLVNPTVLSEGFQTTLLEALAVGGRVITYPVPGARTLRDQGGPVEITCAAQPAALQEALREMTAKVPPQATRALIEQWGWDVRGEQFEAVLRDASGSRWSNYT